MPLMSNGIQIVFKAVDESASKTANQVAASISKLDDSLKPAKTSAAGLGVTLKEMAGSMAVANIASNALESAARLLVEMFKQQIAAAKDAEMTMARLDATLISTGRSAEMTSDSLSSIASQQSLGTMFDDEQILEAMNTLLRFDSVSSESLPRITQAAIDMAAALGTTVPEAANQLGGALETGVIPRAWKLDAATKANIKSLIEMGDESAALEIILDSLGTKFEGQAERMGDTATGAAEQVKIAYENMQEAQGASYLQMSKDFHLWLADYMNGEAEAIAVRTRAIDILHEQGNANAFYSVSLGKIVGASDDAIKAAKDLAKAQLGGAAAMSALSYSTNDVKYQIQSYTDTVDAAAEATENLSMLNSIKDMQGAYDDLTEAANDYFTKLGEVHDMIQNTKPTWQKIDGKWQLSAVPQETLDSLADAEKKYEAARVANEKWIKQFLFSLVQAKLAEGGLTDVELQTLLTVGQNLGMIDPEVAATMQKVMEAINSGDPKGLDDALRAMQELFDFDGETITTYHQTVELPTQNQNPPPQDTQKPAGHQGFGNQTAGDKPFQFFNYGTQIFREPISRRALMDATV